MILAQLPGLAEPPLHHPDRNLPVVSLSGFPQSICQVFCGQFVREAMVSLSGILWALCLGLHGQFVRDAMIGLSGIP